MSRRQVRGAERLAKAGRKRAEFRKVLIVAEGVSTEPQYFERFAAFLKAKAVHVVNSRVSVRSIGLGRDPLSVVQEAERRRGLEKRGGDPYDEVWCVVDVDEHARLERACVAADRLGINMVVSSPCFEIWLLWHFEDRVSWADASTLSRILESRWGFQGKRLPDGFPFGAFGAALRRAERCEQVRVVHSPPNPSCSIPPLIGALVRAHGVEA